MPVSSAADTATSDASVEQLSQPREAPVMTSRPVQVPAIAREMLEQAGRERSGPGLGNGDVDATSRRMDEETIAGARH
jgi:hypothetical protein